MRVMLLTSGVVLLVTCAAFFMFEYVTFRQSSARYLTTLGEMIAANSSGAIAFDDEKTGYEILTALKAEPHIVAACLYRSDSTLFSYYPETFSADNFPRKPGVAGHHVEDTHFAVFLPITQGSKQHGILYLRSDMGAMYSRFQRYAGIVALVIIFSSLVAFLISKYLQRRISDPILGLAETAKAISDRHDYSVRAAKHDDDELGTLTDAFNLMLTRIQEQNLALHESNVRVRAVLNSAMSAVIVIDAQGAIVDWNMRAESMFGWLREEAIGRDLAELILPQDFREAHRKGIQTFIKTGLGPAIDKLLEMTALRRDGTVFPVELSINVLKTGDVLTFCGFVTDITERKKAAEEILRFNQQLEDMVNARTVELEVANKELESFSYSVSHDLRAPLRSIHGYTNILKEDYGSVFDEEGNRLLNTILKNSRHMGILIDDLLAFSKLGRQELSKVPINMFDLVAHVVEDHRSVDATRNIEVSILELENAEGDYSTLRQVWVNLISNAFKYTKQKEKCVIEIGSLRKDNSVTYYVKDNGAGFNMDYYNKLFGVFQRLHSPKEFEGTGVGLAIVQRIVARHGGKVWAEGVPDKGATFYFMLVS